MKIRDLDKTNHASLHLRRSLVVGCGGMGTEAVINFKRALAQHYDTDRNPIIQVLTFDSAQPDWQTPADDQYLRAQDRKRIFADNLENLVRNLEGSPRLDAWFPSFQREQALRIAQEVGHSVQGAASTRPFGRIGLFAHWQDVHDQLRRLIQAEPGAFYTHTGETADVELDAGHVYIVTSLGGGTGTGIFLDLAALTRKILHDLGKETWEVNAILVLPEILVRDPKIGSAYTPQIMANSYAALKELDHFMHGNTFQAQYGDGEASRVTIPGQESGKLFNSVYLVDAENSSRKVFTQRDQLAAMIGEMLFHLTATAIGRNLEHREPDERARMFFQRQLPELKPAEQAVGLVQERRKCLYSTFGLSTLKIPVEALLDYCAIQRALTLAELIGRDEVDDLEQAARRAEELFAGGAGELPLLSKTGLTSRQLDQALSLKRFLEELPEPDDILEDTSPATRLRQLYERMRWSEDAFQQWTMRAQEAGERLRTRYIHGEYREQKDHSPIRDESILKKLVDDLCLKEGIPVVDRLLDLLEQGLVETLALTNQQIEKAQFDLGLSDGSAGHNKFSRQLENLLDDIAGRQATGSLFRVRRNRRRVGAWVVDAVDLLRRFQPRFAQLAVLQEKARVCQDLVGEINRLDDEVLPFRVQGLRFIKNQLRERRNQALTACRRETPPVLAVAPNPQNFYKDQYLPLLGAGEQPASIAAAIRRDGLLLQDGACLTVDQWTERLSEVEEALLYRCRDATALGDEEIPNHTLAGAKGLWRLDFDSHAFSDPLPGEGESDLHRFAVMLKAQAEPYATYDLNDTPSQPWNVVISGSCLGNGSRSWRQWFLSEGVNQIYPGLPNQVTLVMVRKAFPLFKLNRIREWKRYYDEYLGKRWPLHLFKDAADWQEPFIDLEHPCLCPAEELVHLALTHRVVTSDDEGQLAYAHPRPEIQKLFQDEQGRRRQLPLADFTSLLETNRILAAEMLEDVAERIVEVEGGDMVRDPERLADYDPCLAGVIRQLLGLTD